MMMQAHDLAHVSAMQAIARSHFSQQLALPYNVLCVWALGAAILCTQSKAFYAPHAMHHARQAACLRCAVSAGVLAAAAAAAVRRLVLTLLSD
jgi:hypothetical protein